MKNKHNSILFCLLILFVLTNCTNRPKNILKQKDMVAVLVDMHRFEGVVDATRNVVEQNEDLYYFQSILDKHGITQADFDSSLVWYTRYPNRFEKVYTRVVDQLESEKSAILLEYQEISTELISFAEDDIWMDSTLYIYPKDSLELSNLDFTIINPYLLTGDVYKLSFVQRLAPQDSCVNKRFIFRIHYADDIVDSISHPLKNDSLLRRYALRMPANKHLRIDSLSGSLFAADSCQSDIKYIYTDSICLIREYNPSIQDSIRNVFNLPLDSVLIEKFNELNENRKKEGDDIRKIKPLDRNERKIIKPAALMEEIRVAD